MNKLKILIPIYVFIISIFLSPAFFRTNYTDHCSLCGVQCKVVVKMFPIQTKHSASNQCLS